MGLAALLQPTTYDPDSLKAHSLNLIPVTDFDSSIAVVYKLAQDKYYIRSYSDHKWNIYYFNKDQITPVNGLSSTNINLFIPISVANDNYALMNTSSDSDYQVWKLSDNQAALADPIPESIDKLISVSLNADRVNALDVSARATVDSNTLPQGLAPKIVSAYPMKNPQFISNGKLTLIIDRLGVAFTEDHIYLVNPDRTISELKSLGSGAFGTSFDAFVANGVDYIIRSGNSVYQVNSPTAMTKIGNTSKLEYPSYFMKDGFLYFTSTETEKNHVTIYKLQ